MTNDLERIARALCKLDGKDPDGFGMIAVGRSSGGSGTLITRMEAGTVPYWQSYRAAARAAIEAIRDTKVTDDMIYAAIYCGRPARATVEEKLTAEFKAVLNAILTEEG